MRAVACGRLVECAEVAPVLRYVAVSKCMSVTSYFFFADKHSTCFTDIIRRVHLKHSIVSAEDSRDDCPGLGFLYLACHQFKHFHDSPFFFFFFGGGIPCAF